MATQDINTTRRTFMMAGFGAIGVTALAHMVKLPAPPPYIPPSASSVPKLPPELSIDTLTGLWPARPALGVHMEDTAQSDVRKKWQDLGYSWRPSGPILPIFSSRLPKDLADLETNTRKQLFFMIMAPHVAYANHILSLQRQKLLGLASRLPETYTPQEQSFIENLAQAMRLKNKPYVAKLLDHVDVIPASLALAQGAVESGWGTSRFAQQGNALFGVWTWDESQGIVPLGREEGKTHAVKAYPNLFATVTDYMDNLNRHPAYAVLRAERLKSRAAGRAPSGHAMAAGLIDYSARREAYIEELRGVIRVNNLGPTDTADIDLTFTPPNPAV